MDDQPLIPERRYILKLATTKAGAAVTDLKYQINIDSQEHTAAKTLGLNEVAFCNFALDRPIVVDPYENKRELGGFILIDRLTNNTVGVGTIAFSLRRATNVPWQELDIGKTELSALKAQKPTILWLTGLSGAGKSTIANLVQKRLHALGRHTYILDGDNLRHGLNKDLGFVEVDRVENIRRVAEVAKLFVNSGVIVLVSLISPYRQERLMAREMVENDEFIEVFVDTPLEVCEERDPKGHYRKARAGELINFTGIDAPYEPPVNPEIRVDGGTASPKAAVDTILHHLQDQGYLGED
jgi:bifunctional enzyme CysN/CysC